MRRILAVLLIFLFSQFFPGSSVFPIHQAKASGTTYYVANAGNDACNGTSSSLGSSGACSWQTIAHVNAQTFSAGDSILFNKGDTWSGACLIVPSSGSTSSPITIGSYGSGSKPILNPSTVVGNFGFSTNVTLANTLISLANNNAFVDFGASTPALTSYAGLLLTITDNSGKHLTGYIKAAGSGSTPGTLGSEMLTNPGFETPYTSGVAQGWFASGTATETQETTIIHGGTSSQKIVTSGSAAGVFEYPAVTSGGLYVISGWYYLASGTAHLEWTQDIANIIVSTSTTGSWQQLSSKQTTPIGDTNDGPFAKAMASSTIYADDFSLKQVTAPSSTGVTITSTANGSTYNWTSEDSGFNRNDPNGYTYSVSGYVSSVYSTSLTTQPFEVFEDTIPLQEATTSACSDGNWYWSSNILYYTPTSGIVSGHAVTYITSNLTGATNGIDLSNQSYITVNGLRFINAFQGITGTESTAQLNNITVTNNDFFYGYVGYQPWSLTGSSNGTANGNYCYCTGKCITLLDTNNASSNNTATFSNYTETNNILINVGTVNGTTSWATATRVLLDLEGISMQNLQNSLISQNTITGGYNESIYCWTNTGSSCSNNTITRNYVANNNSIAISMHGNGFYSGNLIDYNVLVNTTGSGNAPSGASNGSVFNISNMTGPTAQNLVVNNTIYGGQNVGEFRHYPNYVTFENNIVYNNTADYMIVDGFNSTFIVDKNLYGSTSKTFYLSGVEETFTGWQAFGFDLHSPTPTNPLFISSSDFRLTNLSPAINAGTWLGLFYDYLGNPIRGVPDIGAYENQGGILAFPGMAPH